MGERLRPFSDAWMAPYALAAQLTARAGENAGAGYAALGAGVGGLLSGIGQGKVRREENARSDARYADAQAMRAAEMEMDRVKTAAMVNERALQGATVQLQELMAQQAGPEEIGPVADLVKTLTGNQGSLAQQLQAISISPRGGGCASGRCGVQPPAVAPAAAPSVPAPTAPINVPATSPVSAAPAAPPADDIPAVDPADAYALAARPDALAALRRSTQQELDRLSSYSTKTVGTTRRIAALTSRLQRIDAEIPQAMARAEKAKVDVEVERTTREAAARAGASAKSDAEELAALNADLKTEFKSLAAAKAENARRAQVGAAVDKDREITDPNREDAQQQQRDLIDLRFKNSLALLGERGTQALTRMDKSLANKKALVDYVKAQGGKNPAFDEANVEFDNSMAAARALYAQASDKDSMLPKEVRASLASQADEYLRKAERAEQKMRLSATPSAAGDTLGALRAGAEKAAELMSGRGATPTAPAPTAAPDAAAKQSAAAEFKALPEAARTPAKWAEIKAKYGIK